MQDVKRTFHFKPLVISLGLIGGLLICGLVVFASEFGNALPVYKTLDTGNFGFFGLSWSPDSQKVAVAGSGSARPEQNITIWDVTSGQPLEVLKPTGLNEDSPHFLPDQNYLVAPPFIDPMGFHTGANAFAVWDINTGTVVNSVPGPTPNDSLGNYAERSTISADGSVIAAESSHGLEVTIYATKDWHLLRHLRLSWEVTVPAIALSSDGRYLAVGLQGNAIDIYDVASGGKLKSIEVAAHGLFNTLDFSPDSQYLASNADTSGKSFQEPDGRSTMPEPDHAVTVWRVSDASRVASYPLQKAHNVEKISWSPDGKNVIFAAWGDQTIRIWKLSSPDDEGIVLHYPASRFDNPNFFVSPNGRYLAVHTGSKVHVLSMPESQR